MGPACSEDTLIALAGELEMVERWHERWPPYTLSAVTPTPEGDRSA
jgi:hypothetical protein